MAAKKGIVALRDHAGNFQGHLELSTGKVFDESGNLINQMIPTDDEIIIRGKGPRAGTRIPLSALSDAAAAHYASRQSAALGKPVTMRDHSGNERTVLMDLGITDVHTNATLPNYAAGYKIADGVADVASPSILVPKASDVYYTWDNANDFKRKLPNAASASGGGAVAEVNPTLSNSTYTTVPYALGGFIPTEIASNADTPLKPFQKMTQMVVDALMLEREIRVQTLLQTSGNWDSSVVQTLAAGAKWNGGASSDPVANIHAAIEASYLKVTGIIWSEIVEHDFVRNPAVQKYVGYKSDLDGIPDMAKFAATLKLPPIYTAKMKYVTGGALTYVWGNHVVLIHEPTENPPTSQQDVATSYTMRWNGGEAPDGTMTGGFLVRSFYDPKRGARGGNQLVVVHNDSEQLTSKLVGGLILNAHA